MSGAYSAMLALRVEPAEGVSGRRRSAMWVYGRDGRFPSAWVAVQLGLHFLMLVGLAAMWKWDKVGAVR